MNWILDNVGLGSWRDAADQELLNRESVGCILNVRHDEGDPAKREANAREENYCAAHSVGYHYLPIKDFKEATNDQFVEGVAFIERCVAARKRVLVHCGEGRGRSPSVVAAYLVFKGYGVDDALHLIKSKRDGCFERGDNVHVSNIQKFASQIEEKSARIREKLRNPHT